MSVKRKSRSKNNVSGKKTKHTPFRTWTSNHFIPPCYYAVAGLAAVIISIFLTVPVAPALTVDIPAEYPDILRYEGFADPPITQDDVTRDHGKEKKKALIETLEGRRHFVGDEPLTLRYLVVFPFGARLIRESIRREMSPFEVISLQIGRRTSVEAEKNIEAVPITLTIRLPKKYPVDTYILPAVSVRLSFEHFAVAGQKREEITVTSEPVQLEKVPLYVDVVQRNDRGTIGDALPFMIEIHAGSGSEVLNEYPPETPAKGIKYLSGYEPAPPVVLLESQRSESVAKSYRVIKWTYAVALHDLNEKGVTVEMPPVIWTRQGDENSASGDRPGDESVGGSSAISMEKQFAEAGEKVKIIQPDPITIRSFGITASSGSFKPLKGPLGIPESENNLLYTLPLSLFWSGLVLTFLWMVNCIVQLLHRARQHQITSGVVDTFEPPRPLYDHPVFQRRKLARLVDQARKTFHEKPSRETCSRFQKVLVRMIASRLPKEKRISVQESYAMTATELAGLTGESKELAELRLLEQFLADDQYDFPAHVQK
jgi:hypothetical protein